LVFIAKNDLFYPQFGKDGNFTPWKASMLDKKVA
jgi:hypothetical protein